MQHNFVCISKKLWCRRHIFIVYFRNLLCMVIYYDMKCGRVQHNFVFDCDAISMTQLRFPWFWCDWWKSLKIKMANTKLRKKFLEPKTEGAHLYSILFFYSMYLSQIWSRAAWVLAVFFWETTLIKKDDLYNPPKKFKCPALHLLINNQVAREKEELEKQRRQWMLNEYLLEKVLITGVTAGKEELWQHAATWGLYNKIKLRNFNLKFQNNFILLYRSLFFVTGYKHEREKLEIWIRNWNFDFAQHAQTFFIYIS